MSIFALQLLGEYRSLTPVYKLWRNGKCPMDEFISEIRKDKNLAPELMDIAATLEDIANGKLVPNKKFRKIHLQIGRFVSYEIKSKHLRLYLIHEKPKGKVIILGGKKKNQVRDISRLKRILKEYTNSKY